MTNTNVQMKLNQLIANPYRDLTLFPINDVVVAGLEESIKDTDFWDNLVVRLENNTLADGTTINSTKELAALFESDFNFGDQTFQLCYGHHRYAALEKLKWGDVTLPVKFVNDETMLKMMANENKDSQMNQIAVKLETVRQVKASLEESLRSYKNFSEYKKDGGDLYSNKQGFTNACENGVGFKAVKKFLGKTWSETDIRYSYAVLANIEDGFFLQEDIIDVPSIGLLEAIGGIASFLHVGDSKKETVAPDWPMFFKTQAIADIIDRCKVDTKGWQKVTVAQLRKAKSVLVNEGVNPASYLKSGSAKTAFDIMIATKDLVYDKDKSSEVNLEEIEALRNKDGFEDYHDLDELLKRVTDSVTKSLSRAEAEEDDLDPVDEGDLEKELADADSEITIPNMFEIGDIDGEEDAIVPVGVLAATYIQTAAHVCSGSETLKDRMTELGPDEVFDSAAKELLTSTAQLIFSRLGKETLIDIFNSVTK